VFIGDRKLQRDRRGIERARKIVRALVRTGLLTAEIDAGGEVPMRWVVEALNMLKSEGVPRIHFLGSPDPLNKGGSDR
jgi:hypothetical protein